MHDRGQSYKVNFDFRTVSAPSPEVDTQTGYYFLPAQPPRIRLSTSHLIARALVRTIERLDDDLLEAKGAVHIARPYEYEAR